MKTSKRILSIVLVAMLLLSLLPATALAATNSGGTLQSIDLHIRPPQAGDEIYSMIFLDDQGNVIQSNDTNDWFADNLHCYVNGYWGDENDHNYLLGGYTYTGCFSIYPVDGYTLANNFVLTVNGLSTTSNSGPTANGFFATRDFSIPINDLVIDLSNGPVVLSAAEWERLNGTLMMLSYDGLIVQTQNDGTVKVNNSRYSDWDFIITPDPTNGTATVTQLDSWDIYVGYDNTWTLSEEERLGAYPDGILFYDSLTVIPKLTYIKTIEFTFTTPNEGETIEERQWEMQWTSEDYWIEGNDWYEADANGNPIFTYQPETFETGKTYVMVFSAGTEGATKLFPTNVKLIGTDTRGRTMQFRVSSDLTEPGDSYIDACGLYTVCDPVTIVTQPQNASAPIGEIVSVNVVAQGTGLTYQWWIKNANATKFSKSTVTSSTYTVTMSNKSNGRQVYCVITDANGNEVTTNTVTLTAIGPVIVTQPKDASVPLNSTVSVSVTATGTGLSYTWWIKNAGATKFGKSTITTATYATTMTSKANGRQLYCVITDADGNTVQTNTVTITAS